MSPKPLFPSSPTLILPLVPRFQSPVRCSSLALRSDPVHLAALPICFVRWLTYTSMVISFKLSRVGTRYRPRVRSEPESLALEDRTSGRPKSDESPKHENQSPCLTDCSNQSGEHVASFSLNLYPDGFYIRKPTEGMLLPPLQDVSELLHPYDGISETLFSAIENGWLPGNILDDIPCKYYKGSVFCEV
ncbi:protein PHYTOCHROME-DEPENDENT LATE-FLOWERING-like [Zingiber officinale]|uniref:protein PHYTOCHROME-DEPENDENT LATE-FLOWERING-like n=1 Tax=Zingiber officinale TaxID=94328 RepID=UPI001C4AD149|nr:protein PHYTOCHROME-DEPENDENT LATE-FLOWERING-like [Zingiber officinale]